MDTGVEDITITTATKDIQATASLRSKRRNVTIQRIGDTNLLMVGSDIEIIMTEGMAAEENQSLRENVIAVTRTGTEGIMTNGVN